MTRQAERAKRPARQAIEIIDKRSHQRAPGIRVLPKTVRSRIYRPFDRDGSAVVEWMGEWGIRVDDLDAEPRQRQALEEGGCQRQRVDRRADIVPEAGQGELSSPYTTADRLHRLDDQHRQPTLRKGDRRRQPVRAGPDDDRVVS